MRGRGGPEHLQHGINSLAADPGLNAEPSAGYDGAQQRRNIGAAYAERSPRVNGEGNAVLCPRVRVQDHGRQDDQIAKQDGADGLLPAHPAGDEAARQHVRRNANAHRHPQRSVIVGAPGALFRRNRREVFVVQGRCQLAACSRPGTAARGAPQVSAAARLAEEFSVFHD